MKKVLLTILSCIFLFNFSQAQSFTTLGDTITKDYSTLTAINRLENSITNITNSATDYTWTIIAHNIPTGWTFIGFCDNINCYAASNGVLSGNNFVTGSVQPSQSMHLYPSFDENFPPPSGTVAWMTLSITDNNSFYSDTLTFICTNNSATSVNSVNSSLSPDIKLYPNPANNFVNVVYERSLNVKNIAVYNLIGRMVSIYKVGSTSAKLDIDDLPSGVYFVRLLNDKGIVVGTRRLTHQ